MRTVFLGTPEFAVAPLARLCSLSLTEVVAVVTNLDKPAGRKMILTPPPVKIFAQSKGIPVYQYKSIRKEGVEDMRKLRPDLMITCAFGQILSEEILDIPPLGVYNIHGSLLPKYRGASPVQHAVLCGDKVTGITIMKTDVGVDTGDILFSESIGIGEGETSGDVFAKLSVLGADCIEKAVRLIAAGNVSLTPQDDSAATHTGMISKADAFIDFTDGAELIVNKVRAFNPSPVAFTLLNGQPFKIYRALKAEGKGACGEIISVDGGITVACKDGAVRLLSVQKAGGKVMDGAEFLRGNKIPAGTVLGK